MKQMTPHPAILIVVTGIVITVIGLLWWSTPLFSWLGKLPGDIRLEGDNYRVYLPITTCILISLLLTAVLRLMQFLLK